MSQHLPLVPSEEAFPLHVFDAFGQEPAVYQERIGGSVMVVEKRPENGPITIMTSGVSRLATDSGEKVELAVEVLDGQQGAAIVALKIVCDDIAQNRRVPPVATPWRNTEPFLRGTAISAIVATGSRWGAPFDVVQNESGVAGYVRTLRLLTDYEAYIVSTQGWDALVDAVGSLDGLIDVTRAGLQPIPQQNAEPDPAQLPPPVLSELTSVPPQQDAVLRAPVILTKFHEQYPPRWLTLSNGVFQSVTGAESPEYMADRNNHLMWTVESYLAKFPWAEPFIRSAQEGQTACFSDRSGNFTLEG